MIQLFNKFTEDTVLFCVIKTDKTTTYLDKKFNFICIIESYNEVQFSLEFMILLFQPLEF